MEKITKISETEVKIESTKIVEVTFSLDGLQREYANLEAGIEANKAQKEIIQAEMAKLQTKINTVKSLGVKTEKEVEELESLQKDKTI